MRLAAKIISYIFHPLLLVTYLVAILGLNIPRFLALPPESFLSFLGFVFALTFVLPVANLVMFKAFGTVSSLQMPTRKERLFPFTVITLLYIVVTIMFYYKVKSNIYFNKVMVLVTAMVLVATIVTFFYKISVHSLAICGALGILVPFNKAIETGSLLLPTVVLLLLAGLVMSSRLYLNAHTPRQVMFGAVAGYSIGFFGVFFFF